MSSIINGLELSLVYAMPVLVFGFLYRIGHRLDLSLDAELSLAGVVFAVMLRTYENPVMAVSMGICASACVAAIIFGLVEWGRIRVEVCSLLVAFAVLALHPGVVGQR